jgi:hypothetical protein
MVHLGNSFPVDLGLALNFEAVPAYCRLLIIELTWTFFLPDMMKYQRFSLNRKMLMLLCALQLTTL